MLRSGEIGGGRRSPLRRRLTDWWHGRLSAAPAPLREPVLVPRAAAPPADANAPRWPEARLATSQMIWGDGHVVPGGDEFLYWLFAPLALDPAMTVLDLGVRLGASTRVLAREFGLWASGIEADRELADLAMERSTVAGLARKAPVLHKPLDALDLKPGTYDRIIAIEALHRLPDQRSFVEAVAGGLKRRGQVLITDYFTGGRTAPATAALGGDPGASPPGLRETLDALKRARLSVHICEDESARIRQLIVAGFVSLHEVLARREVTTEMGAPLLAETERWGRRITALANGDLTYTRIVASL